jgi:hypothetical protein
MPCGSDDGVGSSYSVITPVGVMHPIRLAPHSVNQHSPVGAVVMAWGLAARSGSGNSCQERRGRRAGYPRATPRIRGPTTEDRASGGNRRPRTDATVNPASRMAVSVSRLG